MGDLFASVLLSGGRPHLLGNREMTRQNKMEASMYPENSHNPSAL